MEQLFSHHFEAMKNGTTPLPTDFECYRNLVNFYDEKCGRLSDYGMKYLKLMVAECESIKAFPAALDSTKHRIEKVCTNPTEWSKFEWLKTFILNQIFLKFLKNLKELNFFIK